ncbi:TadE/TadG family type IV pilus assembly protein [Avibacterium volantium]|uniref:TadE/TadG family type IV pilus assembly protein n=1 Tax=Avibacterium TaxID=292486 RepID=UPI0039FDDC03
MILSLNKILKPFLTNKKGVSTVEFSLTIVIFLVIVGSLFELARLSILSAYVDSSSMLAIREVKNTENISNYATRVQEKLNSEQQDWNWLNNSSFSVSVKYYGDKNKTGANNSDVIQNIINGNGDNNPKNAIWAEYIINYEYNPMFSWFPKNLVNPMMQRNIVVLQEHER